jgi:hypothetical protein
VSVTELPLALPRADVLQVLGYPQGYVPSPGVERLLDPLIAEARALARARGVWLRLRLERAASVGLEPRPARALVLGLVTVGADLEDAAAARLAHGEATAALVLEACGSAAVEEAADRFGAVIARALDPNVCADGDAAGAGEPSGHVAPIGCRVSPGYARWSLPSQRALFSRLPHAAIGVRLESSCLMVPRKSISFAMWLGADPHPAAGLSGCPRCALAGCAYRTAPQERA